jgi:hypothetical protein
MEHYNDTVAKLKLALVTAADALEVVAHHATVPEFINNGTAASLACLKVLALKTKLRAASCI